MFAGTASSTPPVPNQNLLYGTAAVLIGIDIVLAVMVPVHTVYWTAGPGGTATPFTVIVPQVGYWVHMLLLAALFGGGAVAFAAAWRAGSAFDTPLRMPPSGS